MTSLYVLANEYRAVANTLEDMDLPAESIKDTLEGLAGDLEVKAANVAMVMRNLETTISAIAEAEYQMATRREALENRAESIKEYIKDNMITSGINVISCPYFVLKIQNNPPSVKIDFTESIPPEFMVQPKTPPPQPDKRLIAAAIKNGDHVPGAYLIHTKRLVIK